MLDRIRKVYQLGQSIWYDNIQRRLLENGELKRLIDDGQIYGITSNPSIFQKAIADSSDYDKAIQPLRFSGLTPQEIFYKLAIADIQAAADLFGNLYKTSGGRDGYVSLEVNPLLANDAEATIREAEILWRNVNRPNLMVKIPATREGLPAIRTCIAKGLNINATLVFSNERYAEVMDAYLSGLEDRLAQSLPLGKIASVASFFVSRVDSKVDGMLNQFVKEGRISEEVSGRLLGKAAIANSRLAYQLYKDVFGSERFARLKAAGARTQRPLWASTSTKNPSYSDVMYVDELIAADTVNTVPPQTLSAFQDHGTARIGIPSDPVNSHHVMEELEKMGIPMQSVTAILEEEGVAAFSKSFKDLLETLNKKVAQ
ncbi:MAG: transaldolase [Chloroflexi bacterium]|nr:transaldolase [Chloroflexota bacterium]